MPKPYNTLLTFLIAGALALPTLVQADEAPHCGPAMGPEMGHARLAPMPPPDELADAAAPFLQHIELSETQQDQVFAILHAQAPLLREQRKLMFKSHQSLHTLALSSAYNDATAAALTQTLAKAMATLTLQQVRTEQRLIALLTPAQRHQLDSDEAGGPPHPPRHPG